MRTLILAAALALSPALAACASAPENSPAGRDCFRNDDVNGFSIFDDHNVRVNVGANRAYLLGTPQNIRDLDWSHAIALRSDSGWICVGNGLGVEIIDSNSSMQRRYQIRSVAPAPVEGS